MHSSAAFNKMPSFHLNSFCVCFFTFSNVCFVLSHLLSFPPFLWKEKHTHFYQKPWKKNLFFIFCILLFLVKFGTFSWLIFILSPHITHINKHKHINCQDTFWLGVCAWSMWIMVYMHLCGTSDSLNYLLQ